MSIKGLIFDLDGVITKTTNLHYKAWRDEVAKVGIHFTKSENTTLKGLSRMDTLKGILKIHNKLNNFSWKKLKEMANNKNKNYKEMLDTKLDSSAILPGIIKLLKDAKKLGIKMSIASSSFSAPIILDKIGLKKYFDFIVNPGDVKNGKPAPDIYIAACKGINIKPSEAIGFEDAMPGVIGLRDAKIKTVAITHGEIGEWKIADYVLESTNELDLKNYL